jgi:hypothetical protein
MTLALKPRIAILGALATLLAACASPEQVPHEVPPPPVTSVAQADRQLASVARERAAIEARYAERERVCYNKFFVNNCLDEAKERRRSALTAQRAIEVQAEHFKRQAVVDERDRKLAEAQKRYEEEEARLAAQPLKPSPEAVREAAPPPRKPSTPGRVAQRDARLQAEQAQEAADAEKRARNVRAYERRKAESEERQRRVAERKAEKAEKAAKDAEAAKARAAQEAERARQAVGQ